MRPVLRHALLAAFFLSWLQTTFGQVTITSVGSGPNTSHVLIDFADGGIYQFDVSYLIDATHTAPTGIGLFDIIEANSSLTTARGDFGFGVFIDGISVGGHSNSGFGGGEDWWHFWLRDPSDAEWISPFVGASDRIAQNGSWDGWVYGNAAAPVPEPAAICSIVAGGGLLLSRRNRKGAGHAE